MGFFSWLTCDSHESIPSNYAVAEARAGQRGPRTPKKMLPVKMIDNRGNVWVEENYEGYGVFGGKDFFELLAEMNHAGYPEIQEHGSLRNYGIHLACEWEQCDQEFEEAPHFPKLVTLGCNKSFDDLPDPETCPDQGFFYWED